MFLSSLKDIVLSGISEAEPTVRTIGFNNSRCRSDSKGLSNDIMMITSSKVDAGSFILLLIHVQLVKSADNGMVTFVRPF